MSLPAIALLLVAQAQPFTSFRKLPSANGWAPIVVDLETRRLTIFRENMYRYPSPGLETRNLAYDLYLGLRASGQSRWLTDVRLDEAGYEPGTNLVRTVQRQGGVRVTTTYFAPFDLPARAFVVIAELTAERDVDDVALFSLHNFHLGGGSDHTTQERIAWDGRALIERGSGPGAAVFLPLGSAVHYTASPANPFAIVQQNQHFADSLPAGPVDDLVSGFEMNGGRLAAGSTVRFAMAVGWAPGGDTASLIAAMDAYHAGRAPDVILAAERASWAAWLREGSRPATQDPAEMQVSLQSLAMLRMGQVRETGAPEGQIIASLPPGQWDVAWLRDGLLATRALIETGHYAEAERALEFFLRGPVGDYQAYVGRPYALSVCRYYGNGREESDTNARGPNVELDGFGMYLETLAAFVRAAPDGPAWLTRNFQRIDDGVAGVLVDFRDPQTGLVAADSSIWESHWDGGGRQRWAYTSGTAVIGLESWASVIGALADPARYVTRAGEIRAAMQSQLGSPMGASVEQRSRPGGDFADAQVAMILGPQTIAPSSAQGAATLDFLRSRLFLAGTTRRGYKRNDDGDVYDEREWIVIDLALANAERDRGRASDADALVGWVTGQAMQNFLVIPELFDQTDARYAGEAPMIGFGAGAYVRALIHRSGVEAFDPPVNADAGVADAAAPLNDDASVVPNDDASASAPNDDASPNDDAFDAAFDAGLARTDAGAHAPAPAAQSGCGCATTARDPTSLVLLLTLWLTSRRRPRL